MKKIANFDNNDDFTQKSKPVFTAQMQALITMHQKDLLSIANRLVRSSGTDAEDFLNDFIANQLIRIQDRFDYSLPLLPWATICMQNFFNYLYRKSKAKKNIKYVPSEEGNMDKISEGRNPLEILEDLETTQHQYKKLEEVKKRLSKKDLEILLNLEDGIDFDTLGQTYFPNAADPNRTARQAKCRVLKKLKKLLS